LIFLRAGFFPFGSLAFLPLIPFDFGTNEASPLSPEMLELQGTFSS
jgi:hypothetical protein